MLARMSGVVSVRSASEGSNLRIIIEFGPIEDRVVASAG